MPRTSHVARIADSTEKTAIVRTVDVGKLSSIGITIIAPPTTRKKNVIVQCWKFS